MPLIGILRVRRVLRLIGRMRRVVSRLMVVLFGIVRLIVFRRRMVRGRLEVLRC